MVIGTIADGARNAASQARDAVSQAASAVDDLTRSGADSIQNKVSDTAANLFAEDKFERGSLKDLGSSLWGGAKDLISGKGSLGGLVGGALDTLGLPDWAAGFAAAAIDFGTMNYTAAISHGTGALGQVAEAAGHEGIADFLGTVSDVTGMFHEVGTKVALAAATGGAGAGGLLAQAGAAGQLGQLGQILGQAGKIAGHVETAVDVVGAFRNGDAAGVGGAVLDLFGGSLGGLGDILGGVFDSGVVDILQNALGDGGDLLGAVFEQFGGDGLLSQLPVADILSQMGMSADGLGGLAGPIVDFAREVATNVGQGVELPGTQLFGSSGGQMLLDGLKSIARNHAGEMLTGLGLPVDSLIDEAAWSIEGFLDMASLDPDVARNLAATLTQLASMAASSAVSDMVGTHVRC